MNQSKAIKALAKEKTTSWYRMEVKDSVADVYIYDEISWFGVSANDFVKDLDEIKADTIRLHLNTPGGSVFDGIAIYNALKNHKATVETYIEGLAASSGSIVALAGDKVFMADNAFFMIHEPWTVLVGNSTDLRKTADMLDKITGVMINTYVKASGADEKQVKAWIEDETWFTAAEAKEAGFVDEITDEIEIDAKHDIGVFDKAPEQLLKDFQSHVEPKNKQKPQNKPEPPTRKIRESMRMRLELIESEI